MPQVTGTGSTIQINSRSVNISTCRMHYSVGCSCKADKKLTHTTIVSCALFFFFLASLSFFHMMALARQLAPENTPKRTVTTTIKIPPAYGSGLDANIYFQNCNNNNYDNHLFNDENSRLCEIWVKWVKKFIQREEKLVLR